MTKTITLDKITKRGLPILFTGKPSRKKLGRWGFYEDFIQYPISLEVFPEVSVLRSKYDEKTYLSFYLKEVNENENQYDANFHIRFEPRIGKNLGEEYFDSGLFDVELYRSNPVNGYQIIAAHRTIKLLEYANRIQTFKTYKAHAGREWCNGAFTQYSSFPEIEWIDSFQRMFYSDGKPKGNHYNEIAKPLKISKMDYDFILKSYPVDDNKEKIKENDLIKIILGELK